VDIWTYSAVIAFLSLDTTAVGQFMISRPIVVGTVIGLLVGDPCLGLGIGGLIELLWIGQLPVGNNLPLDVTLLTGLTVVLADGFNAQAGKAVPREALFIFAMSVSIPLALLSSEAEQALRRFHRHWVRWAQKKMEEGRFFQADLVNAAVVLELFLKAFLMSAFGIWLLRLITPWFLNSPPGILHGFMYAHWFLMALGCAAALDLLVERRSLPFFILPAVSAGVVGFFLRVEAIYLILVALLVGLMFCYRDYRSHAAHRMAEPFSATDSRPSIPRGTLFATYLRMFFFQTVWNFERGINYGFAYIMAPVLKRFFPAEERSRSLVRHLEYFNTQPYLASYIVGAVVRMEAERASLPQGRQKQKEEEISALKLGMMSPAAALGDNLFWATIRPFAGLIAINLIFTESFRVSWYHLLIPLVFLTVYNAPHLLVRTSGFIQGFRLGDQVVLAMKQLGFQEAVHGLRSASAVVLGVLVVCMNYYEMQKGLTLFALKMVFFCAMIGLYSYFLHKRVNVALLFYSIVLFALILAYWPDLSASPPFMGNQH